MSHKAARILSVGTSVPDRVVTNDDIARMVETSDEWIATRTGIRQRRIAADVGLGAAAELATRAGAAALSRAGVGPAEVDAVICATFTPDYFFPSTACIVQHRLGCANACAFDLSAACSGFVYGLSVADSMIRSGQCRTILLVGAEVISRSLDWSDRSTCILFGDGAGAVVVQATKDADKGVLSSYLRSDGSMAGILSLPAWGEPRHMKMNGNEVFKHAVRFMSEAMKAACVKAGLSLDDIDLFIPHQANIRIITGLAERMGVSMTRVVTNLERYGNTSSASIPLALEDAWVSGRIKDGTTVVFAAFGGGVTIASAAVRF